MWRFVSEANQNIESEEEHCCVTHKHTTHMLGICTKPQESQVIIRESPNPACMGMQHFYISPKELELKWKFEPKEGDEDRSAINT